MQRPSAGLWYTTPVELLYYSPKLTHKAGLAPKGLQAIYIDKGTSLFVFRAHYWCAFTIAYENCFQGYFRRRLFTYTRIYCSHSRYICLAFRVKSSRNKYNARYVVPFFLLHVIAKSASTAASAVKLVPRERLPTNGFCHMQRKSL